MKPGCCVAALLALSLAVAPALSASGLPDDAVGRLTPDVLPALGPGARWALRPPADGKLVYRGVVSFDHAGFGAGGMFYPGFGLAGFFAALATHGVLLNAAQNSEKTKLQQQADQVLQPYREVLAGFDLRELSQAALDRSRLPGQRQLIGHGESAQGVLDWLVDIAPIFSMTQDQSALLLDNIVVVHTGAGTTGVVYRNIVRVVSQPRGEADLPAYWNADHGAALKAESAALLARSLDLAMRDMARAEGPEAPQRTLRYVEGHAERMERAQLIEEACGRRLLRTLRGWLMSVPASATAPVDDCESPPSPAAGS